MNIILNLIIFAHWSENYQMTNMNSLVESFPMVPKVEWGAVLFGRIITWSPSKTQTNKQTLILIQMIRGTRNWCIHVIFQNLSNDCPWTISKTIHICLIFKPTYFALFSYTPTWIWKGKLPCAFHVHDIYIIHIGLNLTFT